MVSINKEPTEAPPAKNAPATIPTRQPRGRERRPQLVPGLPPELPLVERLEHLIHLLGVDRRRPICTLRKLLNASDANPDQARLQIPYEDARVLLECAGVTASEKALMADSVHKLSMAAFDRHGNQYRMSFAKVASILVGRGMYRLTGDFAPFLRESGLQPGHTLVMWVIRLPAPPTTEEEDVLIGTLAMILLDYKTEKEAEVKKMEAADQGALQSSTAASTLLLINAASRG